MNYKVRENNLADANKLIVELDSLLFEVNEARTYLTPFSDVSRAEHPNPMKYVLETKAKLQNVCLGHFAARYPALQNLIETGGACSDASARLNDAIYKLGSVNTALIECNNLVKSDQVRKDLRSQCEDIIGDLCVYIIVQFELYKDNASPFLAVSEFTETRGFSVDVYYGMLLKMMEEVGQQYYGYEVLSPMYGTMADIDESLLAEAEEAYYPLTDELCEKIISGEIPLPVIRGMIHEYKKTVSYEDVDGVSPLTILKNMHLE